MQFPRHLVVEGLPVPLQVGDRLTVDRPVIGELTTLFTVEDRVIKGIVSVLNVLNLGCTSQFFKVIVIFHSNLLPSKPYRGEESHPPGTHPKRVESATIHRTSAGRPGPESELFLPEKDGEWP